MKKLTLLTVCIVLALVLVGCASTKTAGSATAEDWWNNPPTDTEDYHYEVGTAKGSTVQTSRDWAKANANTALAQYVNNQIEAIVTTYTNDAGELATSNTQALAAFESVSKQSAQATLKGVTYKYATLDDGTTYVLAALPLKNLAEDINKGVEEFVKNSASEEANAMMNSAIKKYYPGSNAQ